MQSGDVALMSELLLLPGVLLDPLPAEVLRERAVLAHLPSRGGSPACAAASGDCI